MQLKTMRGNGAVVLVASCLVVGKFNVAVFDMFLVLIETAAVDAESEKLNAETY